MVAIDVMHETTPEVRKSKIMNSFPSLIDLISTIIQGSSRPLVVKFADTKKAAKGKNGTGSPPESPALSMVGGASTSSTPPIDYWSQATQLIPQQASHNPSDDAQAQNQAYQTYAAALAAGANATSAQGQQLLPFQYLATYPNPSGGASYMYYPSQLPVYQYPANGAGYTLMTDVMGPSQQQQRAASPAAAITQGATSLYNRGPGTQSPAVDSTRQNASMARPPEGMRMPC